MVKYSPARVITFTRAGGGGRVDLVHVEVPSHDHKGARKGWPKYD